MGAEEFYDGITVIIADQTDVLTQIAADQAAATASLEAAVARLTALGIILAGICLYYIFWRKR